MLYYQIVYILLFVILTLFTLAIHPNVHKPVSFENPNFKIEDVENIQKEMTQNVTAITPKSQNKVIQQPQTVIVQNQTAPSTPSPDTMDHNWILQNNNNTNTNNNIQRPNNQQQRIVINSPQSQHPLNTQSPKKQKSFNEIVNESQKNPNRELTNDEVNTVVKTLRGQQNNNNKPQANPAPTSNQNPYMTEQEEIIAWNKWRANFQNTVMRNSNNIAAPLGTVFMYSCIVDKYGNISNINTWSTNPSYTPAAKSSVKPAIVEMQRTSALDFPRGTRRTSTIVAGSFIMSTSDRYATPGDYSDYERVK